VCLEAQAFNQGDVIFREPPLVAAQHAANREHALVCSHCFAYVGSIEVQIARRLLPLVHGDGEH
jgi:hypothetical protein